MLSNKRFNLIIFELFIEGRKLNISHVFITQPYFAILKTIRLNSTQYFIMKINVKYFLNLYKKCTAKPYSSFSY